MVVRSDEQFTRRALQDACRSNAAGDFLKRLCREGEQTVGVLTTNAGISQPAVSKHLSVLKQAGLVLDRHQGRLTHYRPQIGALTPLIDWTRQMAGFWAKPV